VAAWDRGDRVEVASHSNINYGEQGEIVGPEDVDEGTWMVQLDNGDEISVYSDELDGIISTTGSGS
jgi:hypothetical protein